MNRQPKDYVVVSLFDGMSCLQMALNEVGIVPTKYYASEIEKSPIKSTMTLFPNTIQLGDVRFVNGKDLGFVHLLGGGSPCQSFSFAGKRKGMAAKAEFKKPTKGDYWRYLKLVSRDLVALDYEDYTEFCRAEHDMKDKEIIEILTLNHYLELKAQDFEFEGQSYLFWEYVRILHELREINPEIKFLLENVEMGKKWQKVLTRAIGIEPIKINSALVSAQNRKRNYWTNIFSVADGFFGDLKCNIPQPKDEGILLKDILETDVPDKYFLSEKAIEYLNRDSLGRYSDRLAFMNYDDKDKSTCVTANHSKGIPYNMVTCHNTMPRSSKTGKGGTGALSRSDGKMYCLDTGNTNAIEIKGCDYRKDEGLRIRENGKSGTLMARAKRWNIRYTTLQNVWKWVDHKGNFTHTKIFNLKSSRLRILASGINQKK